MKWNMFTQIKISVPQEYVHLQPRSEDSKPYMGILPGAREYSIATCPECSRWLSDHLEKEKFIEEGKNRFLDHTAESSAV